MKLQKFTIKSKSGIKVSGEYEGNLENQEFIVFSHGFGVDRNSRGLFTDISEQLKNDYLLIRFDYNEDTSNENEKIVPPYSVQVEKLKTVIEYVQNKFDVRSLNVIAHSLGNVIVGLYGGEDFDRAILLAPPIQSPYYRMFNYFCKKKKAEMFRDKISRIPRSNGSITLVKPVFWEEMKGIISFKLYLDAAQKTRLRIIRPIKDSVVTDEYPSEISALVEAEIKDNHDFKNSREQLIHIIKGILKS